MDRSSAISSERPRWMISNELICNQLNVLLLHRSDPRQRNQSAFVTQTFGSDIPRVDDPVIDHIHDTIPGMHMVDIFTCLTYLPLCLKPWEQDARKRFKRDLEWCIVRLQRIKNPNLAGKYMPDAFLPSVLRAADLGGFTTAEEAAYLALQLIIGAADTSQISTWSFLEAMLQYPDVQHRARTEIEAVVGDRLPQFADLERIPYIRCVMKEVWRWRPPVALGHPHVTTKDIVDNRQRTPKGSRLHLNTWWGRPHIARRTAWLAIALVRAISHDPKRHEDPDRFWPERYTDDHTTTMQSVSSVDVTKRDHFAFGAGRRICPGYHVAKRSLAIAIMRILWAFEVV
ncbi:putative cytochrome P450 [Aspergillus flavus AF70]|nr:putative cytochrome P450 [Aspergillus flavus AF70]